MIDIFIYILLDFFTIFLGSNLIIPLLSLLIPTKIYFKHINLWLLISPIAVSIYVLVSIIISKGTLKIEHLILFIPIILYLILDTKFNLDKYIKSKKLILFTLLSSFLILLIKNNNYLYPLLAIIISLFYLLFNLYSKELKSNFELGTNINYPKLTTYSHSFLAVLGFNFISTILYTYFMNIYYLETLKCTNEKDIFYVLPLYNQYVKDLCYFLIIYPLILTFSLAIPIFLIYKKKYINYIFYSLTIFFIILISIYFIKELNNNEYIHDFYSNTFMLSLISNFYFFIPLVLILKKRYFIITFYSFLIVYITLPNLQTSCGYNKTSSVRANMHTMQTIIETYAVDWGGTYPKDATELKKEAIKKNYWKNIRNPLRNTLTPFANYPKDNNFINQKNPCKKIQNKIPTGIVLYAPEIINGKVIKYYLYGTINVDHYFKNRNSDSLDNIELLEDKGKIFYLTNQ